MPNNVLIRDHESIDYSPGATREIELPLSHFYERLNLVCSYDVDTDGSDSESGYGILDLIDRIEVEFNGDSTLKSQSFATSHFADWMDYGTRPIYDPVDHTAASNQTGRLQTFVDFLLHPGLRGSLLPSFSFSDLVLRIKWGTDADVGGGVTVNDATVQVQSRERRKHTVPNPPQRTLEDVTSSLLGYKERERVVPLDYDGRHEIDLPRGHTYYSVNVGVIDADAPTNDLIGDVEIVENGVETHKATTFELARAKDLQQYGVEEQPPGYVHLDYGVRDDTDDIVDTSGMDDLELRLHTTQQPTSPSRAHVVTREIID